MICFCQLIEQLAQKKKKKVNKDSWSSCNFVIVSIIYAWSFLAQIVYCDWYYLLSFLNSAFVKTI